MDTMWNESPDRDEWDDGEEWKRAASEPPDQQPRARLAEEGEEPSGYDLLIRTGDKRAAHRFCQVRRRVQAHRPRLCRVCYHEFRGHTCDEVRCKACRTAGRPWNRQAKNAWYHWCAEHGVSGDGWECASA